MYLERLIKNSELTEFESILSPHQKIVDEDGASILQRSIIEHNMLAVSRLYANITFVSLGELLNIPASKAERIATNMISSDQLDGAIDHIEGTVSFKDRSSLNKWDASIVSFCDLLNSINENIAANYPEWHAEKFKEYSNVVDGLNASASIRQQPESSSQPRSVT